MRIATVVANLFTDRIDGLSIGTEDLVLTKQEIKDYAISTHLRL
jgi:hypothetical protein